VEGRRADADQPRRQQDQGEAAHLGHHQDAHQRADHSAGQQVRLGMAIGVITHPRLQQGRGELEREGDQADLGERQAVIGLEHRVDRGQYRLDQVIDQMRQRHRADYTHHQRAGLPGGRRRSHGGLGIAQSHGRFSVQQMDAQVQVRQCATFGCRKAIPLAG
jgi:hypothetical protein